MKWNSRKLFNITYINVMGEEREGPFTSPVWAANEAAAREVWQEDADWAEIQSVESTGKEDWEPVDGPDLPPVRDGLILLFMKRDQSIAATFSRRCTAWVREADKSWQDYSGRGFMDTEVVIAVPVGMFEASRITDGSATAEIDAAWAATVTDWRSNYIDRRQVSAKVVGDAFIVTINWLMDLS